MIDRAKYIEEAKAKYDSYDNNVWIKAGFDENSGGFNVYHIEHDFSETGGGGDAEKKVGEILAKNNGKQVEFLPEGKRMTPDLYFDGQTWEVKYINDANVKTIRGYIEHARRKKSDNGIFYWDFTEKLEHLRSAIVCEVGKFRKLGRIREMPDIYYIDKSGLLKLLWEKIKGCYRTTL